MDELYSLGFLINRASFSLAKALRIELGKQNIDLPHSQFVVLRCIYYRDGMSQHDIATLLCKDAAAIKRTIDNLEEKGLVCREQVSQRQNSVHITEKGREVIPVAIKHAESAVDKVLDSIDEQDVKLLHALLNQIYMNAEKIE